MHVPMLSSHGMSCVSSFQSSIPALLPPLPSPPLPSPPFRFTCTTKLMFRWAGPMGLVSVEGRRGDWPLPFSSSISRRCVCLCVGGEAYGEGEFFVLLSCMNKHVHTHHMHAYTRTYHTHTRHTYSHKTHTLPLPSPTNLPPLRSSFLTSPPLD